MHYINWFAITGFTIRSLSVAYLGFYIGSYQRIEVSELRLRKSRFLQAGRIILAMILFTAISAVPSLVFQYNQFHTPFKSELQKLSAISGSLSFAGLTVLWGLLSQQARRDK